MATQFETAATIDTLTQPFEPLIDPVIESALGIYSQRAQELHNALKDTVADDEWLSIMRLDIAAVHAIDVAWRTGFLFGLHYMTGNFPHQNGSDRYQKG